MGSLEILGVKGGPLQVLANIEGSYFSFDNIPLIFSIFLEVMGVFGSVFSELAILVETLTLKSKLLVI